MTNATVKAVKIKDIRDKEQLYIVIEVEKEVTKEINGQKLKGKEIQKVAINCGQKTFDGVNALLNVEQPTLGDTGMHTNKP